MDSGNRRSPLGSETTYTRVSTGGGCSRVPLEAGGRVAGGRKLDGLARQRLGLACEQRGGSERRRIVAGAGPAAGSVARSVLLECAPAHPPGQFW
jgi:hypothetical protein